MKKTKKKVKNEIVIPEFVPSFPKHQIGELSISFGQEDQNKMVDKINEIIRRLNDVV